MSTSGAPDDDLEDDVALVPPAAGSGAAIGANGAVGNPATTFENARARAKKAPNAFRTISEVADELHIPQHVLRFWETKFPQVKPLKRGGGRRYYRPDDIALLRRISDLLYIQGYTIKGVQRLLREGGGRLSDDIPPATPDEQAAAAAERAEVIVEAEPDAQLAMPGLPPPAPPPSSPPAGIGRTLRVGPDREAERLRAVLTETLRELESLRALLA
jgi:DNA-binding transcriptional MerR regulator